MNNQITIKYKEETLLKSEMTEREKAIWDDGYREGAAEKLNSFSYERFFAGLIIGAIMCLIISQS